MTESINKRITILSLLPVFFSFFIMGFADMVGVSTSYVKQDFELNDKMANILPIMVFIWFAVFSLPTGILMSKIGRKKTVLFSAVITTIAMFIPSVMYSYISVLVAFALLGIGNTILQVSLNPLLAGMVTDRSKVASMLTLGQFIKAISSFLGPVIIGIAVRYSGKWELIFPIYGGFVLLSLIWLQLTPIIEEKREEEKAKTGSIFGLLKNKILLLLFTIILLVVGFEVGLMTAIPKYLMERWSIPLETGGLACSLYFIARTIGTFAGSIILTRVNPRKFLIITVIIGIISFICFMLAFENWMIMASIFLVGVACANIFPITFSIALQLNEDKSNEISALMIMGVAGGALIPPLMGIIADAGNQFISLLIPLTALCYILFASIYSTKKQ